MTAKLPYMLSPGLIPKILEKVQQARRPDRFTQDFLQTKLGHSGGGARPIIPLLKRLGFMSSDGVPTDRYDQFRNADTQGIAIANGMREAFSDLFDRNEYVYELSKDKLTSLVVEITGAAKDDRTTSAIVSTFAALNDLADFEADPNSVGNAPEQEARVDVPSVGKIDEGKKARVSASSNIDFKVGYTINLNLPETTDPEVFNAIFKSLKENLLSD